VDEKRYLIEVLLKARESISQVAQRAAKALDSVTDAQKKQDAQVKSSMEQARRQITVLEQQRAAHIAEKKALDEKADSLRKSAAAARETANADRKRLEELRKTAQLERATAKEREAQDLQEITRMRARAAELDAFAEKKTKAIRAEISQLRKEATAFEALAKEESASNKQRAAQLDLQIAQRQQEARESGRSATAAEQAAARVVSAANKQSRALDQTVKQLERLGRTHEDAARPVGRMTRALDRMGISSSNSRQGLRGLNAEFQGFQVALAIKYAQALISALTALAAQFAAVALAAGQAAIGIGAALASGAAQALPVVGLLIGAFARLGSVLKVVKLTNDQQLTASQDAQRAAKAQQTATDQIRSAEERVADAHRNTARAVRDLSQTRDDAASQEVEAQRAVTQARRDAVRTVEDLMAAEANAAQSLLRAQQARQTAIEGGDVMGAVEAEIDIGTSRRDLRRVRQDAAPARARGVEGIQAVQDAEQRLADVRRQGSRQIAQAEERLADSRRSERQATDDLTRTRRESRDTLEQETAAANKLTDALAQLSPAERQLYRRVLALQETYRRVARPITDIITRAFTGVVDRINQVIQDPRIVRGFRGLATEIANSIGAASNEVGGARGTSFLETMLGEATRNLPQITRIIVNFFRTLQNIAVAGIRAFRLLLDYVEDYSERARDASSNTKGLSDFFVTGVRYAKAFFDLGLAVVNLFLTLAGRGGAAAEGIRTIRDLTDVIDGLTRKARRNADEVRDFFRGTHDVFFALLSVLGTLGATIVDVFSPSSVKAFADFLNRVIIPALGHVIEIMGFLTTLFHQVFSLPGVAAAAEFVATILILARGLTVISSAFSSIGAILPNFLRSMGLLRAGFVGIAAVTPAGWIVGAVMAAVTAVVLLDKKLHFLEPTWRWLKQAATDAFEWIKAAAKDVGDWFSDVWTQGLLYWIRWPFVKAFEYLRDAGVFRWIINAARDVIEWFSDNFGSGGKLEFLGDALLAPFKGAVTGIKVAFRVISTIVRGFLDVIAGRFDDFGTLMGDFWADFVDVGRGAISSLLGVVSDLLGALGEIPKIGGPFKDAAKDVRDAQNAIDESRAKTKEHREEQKKANDTLKDAAPILVRLRERYQDARKEVSKLKPGTDAYREAVKKSKDAHADYNEKLRDTAGKSRAARDPVRRLRSNISNLGDTSADTAAVIAANLNDVLKQVGARTIRLNTRAYRRDKAEVIHEATGHLATGGVLQRYGPPRRKLWGGGMPNPYGGAADDHVLYAPNGAPVAAMSGTEGIVNAPQMGVINGALGLAKQMGAMPWGSLNELWGSGMRHFATGGALQPAIRSLSSRLNRMFGLVTTSGAEPRPGSSSLHNLGIAADISGTPRAMMRAANYIKTSGIWRSLAEGIHKPANLSVDNGRRVPSSFWGAATWNDHVDHIHIAASSLARMIAARVRQPRISGLGGDALSRIARGSARTLTRAANRYLRRQMARMGDVGDHKAMGADANVVRAFRRAIRATGAGPKARLALWMAGIVESGLRNLMRGDRDSLGALQLRAGLHGRALALNPFGSALAFLTRGFTGRGGAIALARNRGMSAGQVAQAVQGSAYPSRYDQVRSRAMRYMQTGGQLGPAKGVTRTVTSFGSMLRTPTGITKALGAVNNIFKDVGDTLEATARGPLRRSKRLAVRIQRALDRITGDKGLLDQLRANVENVTSRAAVALQRRQFRVGPGGPRRVAMSGTQIAEAELQGLQAQRGALGTEREGIQDSIEGAERSLREARRRGNKKAITAAKAALVNLRGRLQANSDALAQNAQDQVEAQENFQQELLNSVNTSAERYSGAVDRWSRMAKALGQKLDPNAVLGAQVNGMRAQIGGLQGVLAEAERTGNRTLADQVRDQIDDLNVSIAEAVAQQFQNSIDAVNERAARRGAALDRRTRLAQLGGRTDFNAMGSILRDRSNSLLEQRFGLQNLLNQAAGAGNIEQVENLTDQIAELDVQLAENTHAIRDNTDAAFAFTTQMINSTAEFTQSVFSGAQGFFQALAENTGINTIPQQLSALQGIVGALTTQQGGLLGQLASMFSWDPGELQQVMSMSGADLVNYLTYLATDPKVANILAGYSPAQQEAFRDLITALIGNATAIETNTDAIKDLTEPGAQSFSSTLWSTFRQAVFTGAGGLLPQYQMAVPTAAIGAKVLSSGMLMVHSGETVKPASISRDYAMAEGDTYHLNVTTPTEVLNPTDVGRQLAFYRRSRGR
jgi:hypothetical protein